jgi:general secretion pathway protein I
VLRWKVQSVSSWRIVEATTHAGCTAFRRSHPSGQSSAVVMMRCLASIKRKAQNQKGFTLVEVVAAIAILALALGVLLEMIGNGIRGTVQSARMIQAGSLARALLAQLGTEIPIREWQGTGEFPGGFRWHVKLQNFGDAGDRQQWPMNAYRVSIAVNWDDGARERSFTLATLRLSPKEQGR